MLVPISKSIIEPTPTSKLVFVNSIEEFEQMSIEPNTTVLAFDNFKQRFYTRECNKYGELSPVMIYFYHNFAQAVQNFEKEEFEKKCKEAGFNAVKIQMAYMFFIENKKPQEVWEYLLENKIKDYSWDYVRNVKCKLKKQLLDKVGYIAKT